MVPEDNKQAGREVDLVVDGLGVDPTVLFDQDCDHGESDFLP